MSCTKYDAICGIYLLVFCYFVFVVFLFHLRNSDGALLGQFLFSLLIRVWVSQMRVKFLRFRLKGRFFFF